MTPQPWNYEFLYCRPQILQIFAGVPQIEDPSCPPPPLPSPTPPFESNGAIKKSQFSNSLVDLEKFESTA